MTLSVACIGGGPGGLFAATLLKRRLPDARVTVYERNRSGETYGFGVVFSDATLARIEAADPGILAELGERGRHWDDIEVRLRGRRLTVGGNGMAAVPRRDLLLLLQDRATAAGVELRFEAEVGLDDVAGADLVVAADGANSGTRDRLADRVGPSFDEAGAKFIWFGTPYPFDGLTFVHTASEHGPFAVHAYPISDSVSTFIVETDPTTWRRAGLDEFDTSRPPGVSDEKSRAYLEGLFADEIDGAPLLVNNSRWGSFRTRRADRWHVDNVAYLGDAVHTAHFSVGSGTKMAMEDAIELAEAVATHDDLGTALVAYEAAARPSVERVQGAARPSLSWWEHFGRYQAAFGPEQFTFHFMSRAISRDRIARRDPGFVAAVDADWRARHGHPPLDTPLALGSQTFPGRRATIVSGARFPELVAGAARHPVARPEHAPPGEWVALVVAPDTEDGLEAAVAPARAALASAAPPVAAAVAGGTALTRVLASEELRLGSRAPVAIVEPAADDDRSATLVLSGRADLVVASPAAALTERAS